MEEQPFRVTLERLEGFRFAADFGQEGVPILVLDEPPPLGEGSGPNAARLLAAAIGNCLAASLLFCLNKSRVGVRDIRTTVEGTITRSKKGRFRLRDIRVRLEPEVPEGQQNRVRRCRDVFEEFCIVTESVRMGMDVAVQVDSTTLKPVGP